MNEFESVTWIAVIAGTIVSFLVGWAWYSEKLFGKKWAEGSGVDLGNASDMPVAAMVTQLIGLFVLALVVGITAQFEMLITAVLAILAVAVFAYSMGAFARKSSYALLVDFFYIIVAGVVMIGFQAIF